ncbi:YaaR family protein [Siminovitchia sp. FSL H7-0308]|jgi:uncharacterized protein|uniref:YaaR family protein n=1 Tax=unclassified Siminovitchia TaxID=2837530 RepID=UPI0030CB4C87
MKINETSKSRSGHFVTGQKIKRTDNPRFSEMISFQGMKLQEEQLATLMADLSAAGERLGKTRSFQDLAKYKQLVKRFVQEAVEFGMNLKQSHSWNRFSDGRTLQIVETIDEKLIELTNDILKEEQQSIYILDKIGEIKGLLIHLYT